MDVIFTILLQKFLWQKCVPVPHIIMGYHTGNVYYGVMRNAPVLVFIVRRKIEMQQTCVQQYVFIFSKMYHVVMFMAYAHKNN